MALSLKVKIIAVVAIVVVLFGGYKLISSATEMTPEQALKSMKFTGSGYENSWGAKIDYATGGKDGKTNHKAFLAIAMYEAKQAKADTNIVKNIFANESDGSKAFQKLGDTSTYSHDVYDNITDAKQDALKKHISNTHITPENIGTPSTNGTKQTFVLKDNSSDAYFKPVKRSFVINNWKKQAVSYIDPSKITVYYQEVVGYNRKLIDSQRYTVKYDGADIVDKADTKKAIIPSWHDYPKNSGTVKINLTNQLADLINIELKDDSTNYKFKDKTATVDLKVLNNNTPNND